MDRKILCLNAGSSSLKFSVYQIQGKSERRALAGAVENIGEEQATFRLSFGDSTKVEKRATGVKSQVQALKEMFMALDNQGLKEFAGAGHRVVHGGPELYDPQRVDAHLLQRLKNLISFAPLHLPAQIAIMEAVASHSPGLEQVACFDTAFHRPTPEVARRFPLPHTLWDQGIFRYGFHGLSYEFVLASVGKNLGNRAIVAHLGNGASMVALKNGAPIDTSMGFTPAGGFMMGSRSGDLDPGILLFLLQNGWSMGQLTAMIEREAGLAGVSGGISDMKTLLERRQTDAASALAIEMFCYQVRKFVGAYAASLNGLDTLVFTGGIGERAAEVRTEICRGLAFLGITLDEAHNAAHSDVITTPESGCAVRVVRTDEDLIVARHTHRVLFHQTG